MQNTLKKNYSSVIKNLGMTFANKSFWRRGTRFNLLESCHSNITLNTAPIVGTKHQEKRLLHTYIPIKPSGYREGIDGLMGFMNDRPKPASLDDVWK